MIMSKKAVLIITDGIGKTEQTEYNAFLSAKTPTYDKLFESTPNSVVDTSGLSVGLPEGQMGNSEVGHMTIGSGRILYQDLVKINLAIEDGSLKDNEAFAKVRKASNRVHVMGLLSDGGVHSHINHLKATASILAEEGKEVFLHLITDGRDVSPQSAKEYVNLLDDLHSNIKIATLGGRFYTMDRDNRWERVELGFKAIDSASPKTDLSPLAYIDASYAKDENDEFIVPTAFAGYEGIQEGDALLCINFRADRVREIITALGDETFDGFERSFKKIHIATMTEYDKSFNYDVLYKKRVPENTLADVVSAAGLNQLHTAETEKYAHVTFFFNGGVDEPVLNESRVLIPSPDVKTYDMKPEMSAAQVGDAVLTAMDEDYDLVVVNFANGDMVGHTGHFEAAITAVETVDHELGRILDKAKDKDYGVLITSDHGNCEEMRSVEGKILTNHTVGSVFCFVAAEGVTSVKDGGLNNIAPTVLKMMELDIPSEMDEPLI
jgi:2,3-bisphosphoglycerate-independent phosphoglycerate mutase